MLGSHFSRSREADPRRLHFAAHSHHPWHPWRRIERGFDQAGLLAEGVARRLQLQCLAALERQRCTAVQGAPGSPSRRANVEGAFRVDASLGPRLAAGRVWLVDDVATSGATLDACASALRRAGARKVTALVLARAG
jgi:predicted amidophosphoribosyltransferase